MEKVHGGQPRVGLGGGRGRWGEWPAGGHGFRALLLHQVNKKSCGDVMYVCVRARVRVCVRACIPVWRQP